MKKVKHTSWWMMFAWIAGIILSGLHTHAQVPAELNLRVGQQETIRFDEAVRAANPSDPAVVGLQGIGERELLVCGLKQGTSTVDYTLRGEGRGRIEVTVGDGSEIQAIQEWLNRQLRGVIGVDTRINESLGVVEVEGTVRLGAAYDQVERVVEQASAIWPRKIINSVEFAPDTDYAARVVLEYLKENDIAGATVNLRNRRMTIGGTARSEADLERVSRGVGEVVEHLQLGEININNRIQVNEVAIEIEMKFFQMSEGVIKEIGGGHVWRGQAEVHGGRQCATGQDYQHARGKRTGRYDLLDHGAHRERRGGLLAVRRNDRDRQAR